MSEALGRLRIPLYLVAFLFLVTPLIDVVTNVLPFHPETVQWRFGATGVASNYLISVVFGASLATLVAALTARRVTLRVLGVFGLILATVFLLLSLSLALDTLQLRREVPEEALRQFLIGGAKTFFKLVTTALALGALAWALIGTEAVPPPPVAGATEGPEFLINKRT